MKRTELLEKARSMVAGEREGEYGTPEDNFRSIGKLWGVYLGRDPIPAHDVAAMMALLKIVRIRASGGQHADSWVDLAGYAACGAEAATRPLTAVPAHVPPIKAGAYSPVDLPPSKCSLCGNYTELLPSGKCPLCTHRTETP